LIVHYINPKESFIRKFEFSEIMGLKDIFAGIFEDSEEELKADIKEAEELIKDRHQQLEELRRGKERRKDTAKKARARPVPKKIIKKPKKTNYADYLYFIIPVAIAVVIIIIGLSLSSVQKEERGIYCEGDEECPDCEIVVSCVELSDEALAFRLTNQMNADGECIVDILFSQEAKLIDKKTYGVGKIKQKETIKTQVPIDMPTGNTQISVLSTCDWI
jgi:hypothetical protein